MHRDPQSTEMTDYYSTQDRSNNHALANTADGMSQITRQFAETIFRQDRKVNAGTSLQEKLAAPWYHRFDKRRAGLPIKFR